VTIDPRVDIGHVHL